MCVLYLYKIITMKILSQKFRINLIAIALIAMGAATGCSKETAVIPTPAQSVANPNTVSIEVLSAYYANLIKADKKLVTYDEKTDQFLFLGFPQNLTRKKLTEIYLANNNPKN
jgi:hypothetical protein